MHPVALGKNFIFIGLFGGPVELGRVGGAEHWSFATDLRIFLNSVRYSENAFVKSILSKLFEGSLS